MPKDHWTSRIGIVAALLSLPLCGFAEEYRACGFHSAGSSSEFERLTEQLSADDFSVRERASEDLYYLGPVARPRLLEQLHAELDAEARLRLSNVLARWDADARAIRRLPMFRFAIASRSPYVLNGRYVALPWSPQPTYGIWSAKLEQSFPYASLQPAANVYARMLTLTGQVQEETLTPAYNETNSYFSDSRIESHEWCNEDYLLYRINDGC
ncbi:MAG: hypothetical protein HS116_14660 [Planctomycetes bacterium]|nr:hypothetical protein [Planctomycetota bacterium]